MNVLIVIVNFNLVSKVDLKTGVTRARLTLCEVGVFFERNITTLENTPAPLFVEPLKFIAHGHIFERLQYDA